ncbi:hypothetical protein U1839_02370 [Sphingomonas sp. RT2P30]|uniref:hypothetical protein n=1 Tax=Parasphingomonas halimpatiens TaxID=3096162 RepID=UPI002FC83F70
MKKIVIASMIAAASLGLAACKKDAPIDNATANELTVANEADTVTNLGDAPVDANATANVAAPEAAGNVTGNTM